MREREGEQGLLTWCLCAGANMVTSRLQHLATAARRWPAAAPPTAVCWFSSAKRGSPVVLCMLARPPSSPFRISSAHPLLLRVLVAAASAQSHASTIAQPRSHSLPAAPMLGLFVLARTQRSGSTPSARFGGMGLIRIFEEYSL